MTADDLLHIHSGKVRDLYRTSDGRLVMVATDRISAFDFILDSPIPDKGRILTAMSVWWFGQLADVVPNHMISTDDARFQLSGVAARCSVNRSTWCRSRQSRAVTSPAPASSTTAPPGRSAGSSSRAVSSTATAFRADLHASYEGRPG